MKLSEIYKEYYKLTNDARAAAILTETYCSHFSGAYPESWDTDEN